MSVTITVQPTQVNVAHRIDLGSGSDHSTALKALITEYGSAEYYLPRGSNSLKLPLQLASHAGGTGIPSLPDKAKLIGQGRGSTIQVTGWETVTNSSNYAAIEVYGASKTDVWLKDLYVLGDWSARTGTPGSTWTNGQPAAVFIYGTANTLRDTYITGCVFSNHWGFPVHATGGEYRTVGQFNKILNCGNGWNVNSEFSELLNCYFEGVEGAEMSDKGILIANNTFVNVLNSAVSIGGNLSAVEHQGSRVVGNRIYTVVNGNGIIAAENTGYLLIADNYVEDIDTSYYGIALNDSAAYSEGALVTGNMVVGGGSAAYYCNAPKAQFTNNIARNDTGITSQEHLYGFKAAAGATGLVIGAGNYFEGKNYAAEFTTITDVTVIPGNIFPTGGIGTLSFTSSAALANAKHVGHILNRLSGATGTYNVTHADATYQVDCTSASKTFNLPTAVGVPGKRYVFTKVDSSANTVTIDGSSTQTINGALTFVLGGQYQRVEIESDGANWIVLNQETDRATPRTATAAGTTTGTIADGTTDVTVTSSSVNNIIVLPTPTPGVKVRLMNGGTGYELRTSDPTTIAINGGTGAAAESAIPANTLVECYCATATAWLCRNTDTAGTITATEVAAP